MADLTPQDEYNKKVREASRELEKQTATLRTPFKQLVGRIKETNAEFAKIAADNIGQTQDTWKGLITQGKKERLIKAQKADEEFKAASAAVKKQAEQQAILETEKQKLEEDYIVNREEAIKADVYGKNSLRALNEQQMFLENKFNNATNAEKIKIAEQLESLAGTISTRKSNITKTLDAEKDRELKSIDKRIRDEQLAIREQRKYVDETNATLENELEKASKTENYDKFTKGIKTLSGGLIDIAGVLDPIAETWGAFRDVTAVTQEFYKNLRGNNKREEIRGEKIDQFTELTDENVETMEGVSDDLQIVTGGIGTALGLIALGILAPIIAIIATIAAISAAVSAESFAGVGQAIKTFATKFGDVLTKGKDLISKGVSRLQKLNPFAAADDVVPPKGPLKADGTPDKRFKANKGTDVVDDALKGTGNVVDDVAKGGGGIFGALKGAAKTLVKKLPFIGAAADTVLDGMDNIKDIDELRKAREDGTLQKTVIGEDGTETKRDYTDEEFAELEVAFKNNMAGSAGKGVGSFAGGATGAVAGAKLGAMLGTVGGPLGMAVGGFLGTLVGGVAGAVMGGKAGDKIATELSEEVLGGDGSEAVIAEALGNIDKPSGTAIGDGTTELNSEKEQATAVVVANTNVVNDNSSSSSSTSVMSGQTTQDNSTGSRLASQTE